MLVSLVILLFGPISKFEKEPPDVEYLSAAKVFDVERCLIDTEGYLIPHVFRQPDQPNKVRLVWTSPGGISGIRVDLNGLSSGTRVQSWKMKSSILERCAPTGPAQK